MFQTYQIAATRGYNSVCVQNLQKGVFKTFQLKIGEDQQFLSQLSKNLINLKLGSPIFYSDNILDHQFNASAQTNLTFPFHFQAVYLLDLDSLELLDYILNKLNLTVHSLCVYRFEQNAIERLNKILESSNIHQMSFVDCEPEISNGFESNYIVECSKSNVQKDEISFVNNISFFIECQNFNPASYKKLFLQNGKAYIDPWNSYELELLKLDRRHIIDALKKDIFIQSSIKQKTAVCCDCEYRNMCYDLKKPLWNEATKLWCHKQECNYNPYIAKWSHEEGYRTLEECGVTSNENGFSIDHEMIAKINEELWGEE